MTSQELALLQRSANLCNQRNQLLNRLNSLNAQKNTYAQKLPRDPQTAAKAAGKAAAKDRMIPSLWVWCVAMVAFFIPFIICAVIYKVTHIEDEYFLLIGEGIGFVTFFLALIHYHKVDKQRIRKKTENQYMAEYNQSSRHNQAQYQQLAQQANSLSQQYNALVRKMQDPAQCCIPASHWYHGQELYRLINGNRASTLQEAIQLQNQIEARDAAYWKSVQDYPRQVEARIALENKEFLDDMEKMARLGMILSDD